MRRIFLRLPAALLVLLTGCSPWSMLDGTYRQDARNFEVNFPKGWRRDTRVGDVLLATKDGVRLQVIQISRTGVDEDLTFTKRKYTKEMLPGEVAEVAVDNLRSVTYRTQFEVLENTPDSICGLPGFRVLARWKSLEGLGERDLLYGVMYDEKVYEILYEAPERYYFGRDSAEAVSVMQGFTLRDHRHERE